jgi:hypothetical protein
MLGFLQDMYDFIHYGDFSNPWTFYWRLATVFAALFGTVPPMIRSERGKGERDLIYFFGR